MKRLIVSIIILTSGCGSQHQLIESQFNYKGRFNEYETFGFMTSEPNSSGINNYDSRMIESMIYKRFTAMGYQYDADQPDLMITYKFFKKGTSLVTMDQASLNNWIHGSKRYDDIYLPKRTMNKDSGTLSIYFVDRKTSSIVFQGFFKDYQTGHADHRILSSIGQLLDNYQITKY